MKSSTPTARKIALQALSDRAGNFTAHLNRLLSENTLSAADAALARELTMGIVRRRNTLEKIIISFLSKRRRNLPEKVKRILMLGTYQLLFLERIPDFAAVDETVELIGKNASLRGFVNAVLRNIARSVSPIMQGQPPIESDVLPITSKTYRRFDRTIFSNPDTNPLGYLSQAYSLPEELASRWLKSFGSLEKVIPIAIHSNSRPPMIVRVNSIKSDVKTVLDRLKEKAISAEPHENGISVVILDNVNLQELDIFTEGLIQPQDPTASEVITSAGIRPGMRVLDLCAAPGTKTTHIAELMQNQGEIIATDVNEEKLRPIQENCQRMGINIVQTLLAEQIASLQPESFDFVLIDVPCSNTGVLARRPEARWRFSAKSLQKIIRDQHFLIELGANMLKRGGRCVYSTCSLEPEENERVIKKFLSKHPSFSLIKENKILPAGADEPTKWHDGGYLAILTRGGR